MNPQSPLSLIDIVAFWGAVTGTFSLAIAYFSYLRDAVSIRVNAKKDWFAVGHPTFNTDEKLVVVEVSNRGRRPVTITMVAYNYLTKTGSVILPPIESRELLEGKSTRYVIKQSEVDDFSEISHFAAYDAVGNNYKVYVAPFYKRFFYWLIFLVYLKKREKPKRDKT